MRVYKGETVFDWDSEPSSERPSAFAESTQYGRVWAPSARAPSSTLEVARPRPPRKRGGIGTAWVVTIIGLAVAAGVLFGYLKSRPVARADLSRHAPLPASAEA